MAAQEGGVGSKLPLILAGAGVAVSTAAAVLWASLKATKQDHVKGNKKSSGSEKQDEDEVWREIPDSMTLKRKLRKSDEAMMSELNTFIKASLLLKREKVINPEGPYPQWWELVKKVVGMGAQVSEVPLDHRMPMLQKGHTWCFQAIELLEEEEKNEQKRKIATIYIWITLAVFRSCFYELMPEQDFTVNCYLRALSECARPQLPSTDSLLKSVFVHCIANAFRRTRTGSQQMTTDKITTLSQLAIRSIAPANPKAPSPADIQRYCTIMVCMSSSMLFCRNFAAAKEAVRPLVTELPSTIDEDDIDMSSQLIDAFIIYTRCLTEEKKMDTALKTLQDLIKWLNRKVAIIAPRKVVCALNRWRPDLSSFNNPMLWSTLTAYQLKLMEANPKAFKLEELAQLLLLMSVHLCHVNQFDKAIESVQKAQKVLADMNPELYASTLGTLQAHMVKGWALAGHATKVKNPQEQKKLFKAAYKTLERVQTLNTELLSTTVQLAILVKLIWVAERIPDDPEIAANLNALMQDEQIRQLAKDEKLLSWGQNFPGDLMTPYWALSF